jgi:malonyl CoA-acyl carrier protein transacylase
VAVDTEVAIITASVVLTEATGTAVGEATSKTVVGGAIPEATVIQMTGRSEERKIGHLVSRTTTANTTVDIAMEIAGVKAVAAGKDVMIEDLAVMTETASAKRKNGMHEALNWKTVTDS